MTMMTIMLSKYPIIYKNKEYEVRWEREYLCPGVYADTECVIYEVKPLFKFKRYKEVFRIYESAIIMNLSTEKCYKSTDPDYLVKEVTILFCRYQKELDKQSLSQTQKDKLAAWNGVIK